MIRFTDLKFNQVSKNVNNFPPILDLNLSLTDSIRKSAKSAKKLNLYRNKIIIAKDFPYV